MEESLLDKYLLDINQTDISQEHSLQITGILRKYFYPVLISITLVSNLTSLIVYKQSIRWSHHRYVSYIHYIYGLCISGLLQYVTLFIDWLQSVGVDVYRKEIVCMFTIYIHKSAAFLYMWYMVSICVNAFITMWHPVLAKTMATGWRAGSVCIGLAIVTICIYFNVTLMNGVVNMAGTKLCTILPEYRYLIDVVIVGDLVCNCFLSLGAIIVLDILIVLSLVGLVKAVSTNAQHRASAKMVVVLSLVYILYTMPECMTRSVMVLGNKRTSSAIFLAEQLFRAVACVSGAFNWIIFLKFDALFYDQFFRFVPRQG